MVYTMRYTASVDADYCCGNTVVCIFFMYCLCTLIPCMSTEVAKVNIFGLTTETTLLATFAVLFRTLANVIFVVCDISCSRTNAKVDLRSFYTLISPHLKPFVGYSRF